MQREGTCKLCDLAGGKSEPCLGMGKPSTVRGGNEREPMLVSTKWCLGCILKTKGNRQRSWFTNFLIINKYTFIALKKNPSIPEIEVLVTPSQPFLPFPTPELKPVFTVCWILFIRKSSETTGEKDKVTSKTWRNDRNERIPVSLNFYR